MFTYLIFGITYAFACVVQPGPFQAFLFSRSLTNGWRNTLPLVLVPLISDIPVIVLVLLILTELPPQVLGLMQIIGGIFLLYLAYGAYKSWRNFDQGKELNKKHELNFLKAVLVNLLNPNPYLGWSLVMGPMLIKAWKSDPAWGIVLLAGFYGSLIAGSSVMVILFSVAGKLGPGVSRVSIGISVIAFALFGFYQLWAGFVVI